MALDSALSTFVLYPEHTQNTTYENLTDLQRKLLHEACYKGVQIQFWSFSDERWIDCRDNEPLWWEKLKYRVKNKYEYVLPVFQQHTVEPEIKQEVQQDNYESKLHDEYAGIALNALITKFPPVLYTLDADAENQYKAMVRGAWEYANTMMEIRKTHKITV